MLNLNLVRTKEKAEVSCEVYEIGYYEVSVVTYKNKNTRIISVANKDRSVDYVPEIYYEDECFGNGKKKFRIQTTSYGALDVLEIQKFITGYKVAVEVVEVLTKEFIA